jgi:hypothetical protein
VTKVIPYEPPTQLQTKNKLATKAAQQQVPYCKPGLSYLPSCLRHFLFSSEKLKLVKLMEVLDLIKGFFDSFSRISKKEYRLIIQIIIKLNCS